MSEPSVSAVVKIRMEVEVTVGNWSGASSFDTLREQAQREATQRLQGIFHSKSGVRIIGQPKSMHVIMVDPT